MQLTLASLFWLRPRLTSCRKVHFLRVTSNELLIAGFVVVVAVAACIEVVVL